MLEHTATIREFGVRTQDVEYVLRPGGYVIVHNDKDEIAVARVNGCCFLPGGGQNDGESPEDAAVRETFEECGLRIGNLLRIGIADELVHARQEHSHFRKRCTFMTAELNGAIGHGEGDHELIWLPMAAALGMLTQESQRWAVGEVIARLARRHAAEGECGFGEE
jgi:8-oxo-dGTP pyrophosphatase MutT (NUDIX family)